MVFKVRIGSDSDWIISDQIRILKFTNYRIGNFQSDPMHTFKIQYLAELWQNYTIGMDIYNHPVGYWIIFEN